MATVPPGAPTGGTSVSAATLERSHSVGQDADWWVDSKDVVVGVKIGAGAFSTVYGECNTLQLSK
jgi:hypothetical protein